MTAPPSNRGMFDEDESGNITLNKAGYFSFAFNVDEEDGSKIDLTNADIRLYVDKVGIEIVPLRDGVDPTILHFTFTTEHAETIGKKHLSWIIREVVAGVPEVLVEGKTITAEVNSPELFAACEAFFTADD